FYYPSSVISGCPSTLPHLVHCRSPSQHHQVEFGGKSSPGGTSSTLPRSVVIHRRRGRLVLFLVAGFVILPPAFCYRVSLENSFRCIYQSPFSLPILLPIR